VYQRSAGSLDMPEEPRQSPGRYGDL